jgi:nucleoside-diphosphate-sugar epimerase
MQVGLVDSLRSGRPTVIRSGDNFVSLVHVEDMARAALLALTTPHDSATFNVCAPPLRQREYVAWLAEAWGTPPPVQRVDAPVPPSFRCTADRIRERLGWTPTVPIVRRP